jgi:hypothetical protein
MSPTGPAARIRGTATGLVTAALAVAAHGVGSGAAPAGAAVVQLAILAATVGAVAASVARTSQFGVLVWLLAAGQLIGHVMLGAAGHQHAASGAPASAVMLAAHIVAIGAGALLIAAGDRLCRAVSRVVGVAEPVILTPVPATVTVAARRCDQPLRSALLLAASVSHRGPPVGFAH